MLRTLAFADRRCRRGAFVEGYYSKSKNDKSPVTGLIFSAQLFHHVWQMFDLSIQMIEVIPPEEPPDNARLVQTA